MTKFSSLNNFKEIKKISDNKGGEISFIFKKIFHKYLYDEFDDNEINNLIDNLLEASKEINPTLIPYSEITNIIFTLYYDNGKEATFTEKLKSKFEKRIIAKFAIIKNTKPLSNNEDLFTTPSQNENTTLIISEDYQNSLLVIYKIIQHAELALSQKQSLYESLKNDIDSLNYSVHSATEKYDNMMSNFISILGIFAAIMMATFGAIQGFTAIFSNENHYNLTTIILISCFGLFALISILFILLHSISKLIDKDLVNHYYEGTFFSKYPIYSHTLLFLLVIFVAALTHFFKLNPPSYMPDHLSENLWSYSLLVGILTVIIYFLHIFISQSYGYSHLNIHINSYIMKFKNKIGLKTLLNILLSVIGFLILIVMILITINIII